MEGLVERRSGMASGKTGSCLVLRRTSQLMGSIFRYHIPRTQAIHYSLNIRGHFAIYDSHVHLLRTNISEMNHAFCEIFVLHCLSKQRGPGPSQFIAFPTQQLLCNPHGGHTAMTSQHLFRGKRGGG